MRSMTVEEKRIIEAVLGEEARFPQAVSQAERLWSFIAEEVPVTSRAARAFCKTIEALGVAQDISFTLREPGSAMVQMTVGEVPGRGDDPDDPVKVIVRMRDGFLASQTPPLGWPRILLTIKHQRCSNPNRADYVEGRGC